MILAGSISTLVLIVTLFRFPFSYVSLILISIAIYHVNIYVDPDNFSELFKRVTFLSSVVFLLTLYN